MKKVIILADDLTGANDVGLQLHDLGLSCGSLIFEKCKRFNKEYKYFSSKVYPAPSGGARVNILVIDTESRLISPDMAYKKLRGLLKVIQRYKIQKYYKKIDSTLRGNIGYEIDACLDELSLDVIPFIPAFPEMQRITVYGHHYVNQKLLKDSEFALDMLNPVKTSSLIDLIGQQSKYKCALIDIDTINKGVKFVKNKISKLRLDGNKILIFDCKDNKNLKTISRVVQNFKMVCGASRLAKEIFKNKSKARTNVSSHMHQKSRGKVACIIGSLKDITAKQVKYIKDRFNVPVLKISPKMLLENIQLIKKIISKKTKTDVIVYLSNDRNSLKYISQLIRSSSVQKTGEEISLKLGEIAKYLVDKLEFNKLVLSGGATAAGVCRKLNISFLLLTKRIFTGIPLTYSAKGKLHIVTKPGGFGNKDVLVKIFKVLKHL
ncbi:MAG: four-carbon acid sugar kinase family protein [Candidatus Firestonebacteria bacterium]